MRMRFSPLFILLLFISSAAVFAIDVASPAPSPATVQLEPNAAIHLEFPDLPTTFYAQSTKHPVPAQLTAQLPANYSKTGKYPVFVFLSGGNGGQGDLGAVKGVRNQIGNQDYIALSLPLFRNPNATPATIPLPKVFPSDIPPATVAAMKTARNGFMVTGDDYAAVGPAYATMLKAFFDAVPNVDPDRSVIAGFSNGAHTIGALLGAKDAFILAHFHSFAMVEGGNALVIQGKDGLTPELKSHRYLFLYGEGSDAEKAKQPQLAAYRPIVMEILKQYVQDAQALGFDVTLVTMPNTGHDFPPQYRSEVKQWVLTGKVPAT